jgi:hypothetical protein
MALGLPRKSSAPPYSALQPENASEEIVFVTVIFWAQAPFLSNRERVGEYTGFVERQNTYKNHRTSDEFWLL